MQKDNKEVENELRQLETELTQLQPEVSEHGKQNFERIRMGINSLQSSFDDYKWQSVKRDIDDLKNELSQSGGYRLSSIAQRVDAVDRALKK